MIQRKPEAKPTAPPTPAGPIDWCDLASEIRAAAALAAALHVHHARDDRNASPDSTQVQPSGDSDKADACASAAEARREATSVLYACLLKGVRDARIDRQRAMGDAA
ncbi:MAG: hypothetical protein HUU22_10445 [Phycisphaerae bacterium]|nr:hypothetical protein [Phycisphaerae bacterium]NUQ46441.1 hypothetical protein [Phycisphaerae bacterium]